MRIVKLPDLSEEDKKRIQERQIQNLRTNGQNRIEANKKFNELINQKGEFDTSRHTSTVGKLQKAYKNNETVNKSLNDYYKNNTTSLWKGTQNFSDATWKIGENTYKGAENGILSAIQNLGRNMFNLQGRKEEENIFDKVNKQILDSRKDLSSEEKTNIADKMNNSSFSQKNLIKGIEEKNQKFQEKKNENTLKIQQNTDSISNPVGKYIAGEIAPGIGQMLPGMLPGIGTTYFISSATGNYHDDAIQRGMTENQATIYSGTMGIIEGALESLGANLTKNVGKQLLKKNIKGALVNYGLDIGENFLEESIVEPISEIAAQVYGGKDKADWSDVWQRAIESGVAGALTSAITGGVSGMIGGIGSKVTQQNQYIDYNTNKKLNKDSQNWLKQAENIIQENNNAKLSPQLEQNQQNTSTQQITPTIQNNVQNGISEQINNAPISQEKQQQIIQNKLNTEIQQATQNKTSKGKVTLGKVTENIAQRVKILLGINVENRTHILSDNDIRHMLNEHGDPIKESKKGQIAITTEDISKIPEIISSYDDIIKGNVNKNGETIRYIKNFEDGTTYMVEVVPENSKTLNVKTMWKKPTTLTNNQQIPSSTPMTTDSSISSTTNTIIPQNNQNMQVQQEKVKEPISLSAKEKIGITRHDIIQKNREIARKNIENISTWRDKNNGLKYQLETMERNMYDIIPDKAEAKQMIDTYFEPIHQSEADKQKFINKYNDKIKELRLNKYESEAVQLLGEQKYNPSFKAKDVQDILNRVNDNINKNKIDKSKVDIAIETFRSIYDELFELENKALIENGYQEKPYRKGYFPHFIDYIPETKTEKVLNMLGFKIDKRPLPTNIAGITEQFVPGKTWNKSALERKTDKTDYNALKGFDTYIAQAADNIFHTENIQRLRGLENEIRYQYSDEGIKERIDNILNDDSLYQEEKQDLIDGIFKQVENPMPNLVTELRRYTNALANKKSEADRSIENKIGRSIYSTVNAIENRFGANAVGLNIGSAITNFIPITQAYSQVSSKNMSRAMIDTVKSYVNDDGFVNKSAFLTNRLNQSEKLYKTTIEKISDKTNFLFNGIDEVTSNIVVRGKYLENIENGMTEIDAMKDADNFARKVIGDRSKGSLPTIFEEKNPVTKMFTQFQLEVNNQFRYMFKDLPRDLAEKGLGAIALAFFKMFIGAWLYNEASEKITGRKPAFSPIDLAISAYKNITNQDKKTYEKIVNISTEVGEQLPFVGGLLGGGRVPVNGAIPGISNLTKGTVGLITGEMDSKKAVNTIGKELAKPLYYLLPPFGGAQLKKSIEGIKTVTDGGSYGIDNKGNKTLQFPVENPTAKEYIKAGLFGKYALPLAKTYTENGYTSLNAKDTKTYEDSKLTYKEYLEYKEADLKTNKDKIEYIKSKNMTTEQKWGIYINDVFSTTERKEDGGSQLKDAEYITSDGVSKSDYINIYNKAQQNNIDMPTIDEYKKMKTNNISLNNYMDYKVKIKQLEENKRKRKELSETENLKNTDKIQILLDSNYSDKTISGIYANYIRSKKDTEYDIMKATGINVREYLKYKQQEFESDKYDDGTLTGKTISKSKQQKFVKYVNSMNIKGNQRLLLYAMQGYSMTASQKEKVANYVKELKLDKDTKLKLYDKFNGFTVYKDGKIKY